MHRGQLDQVVGGILVGCRWDGDSKRSFLDGRSRLTARTIQGLARSCICTLTTSHGMPILWT